VKLHKIINTTTGEEAVTTAAGLDAHLANGYELEKPSKASRKKNLADDAPAEQE
jgi:hypothetical protein